MNIRYTRQNTHSYLVINVPEQALLKSFHTGMLLSGRAFGLLPCHLTEVDNVCALYYDITSLKPLSLLLSGSASQGFYALQLLRSIVLILGGLDDFLLDRDRVLLSPELIFVHPGTLEVLLCYYPGNPSEKENGSLKTLLPWILTHSDPEDEAGGLLLLRLYRASAGPDISFEVLRNLLASPVESGGSGDSPVSSREMNFHAKGNLFFAKEGASLPGSGDILPEAGDVLPETGDVLREGTDAFALENKLSEEEAEENTDKSSPHGKVGRFLLFSVFFFCASYLVVRTITGDVLPLRYLPLLILPILLLSLLVLLFKNHRKKARDCGHISSSDADFGSVSPCSSMSSEIKNIPFPRNTSDEPVQGGAISGTPVIPEHIPHIPSFTSDEDTYTTLLTAPRKETAKQTLRLIPANQGLPALTPQGAFARIGKLPQTADLIIPDPAVSRLHARLSEDAGIWYLEDLNSKNGTTVNSTLLMPFEKRKLCSGDHVRFAAAEYTIQLD